jgi:hypothetical protein
MNKKILILNMVWFSVLVCSVYGVYENTKKSYFQVGRNHGIVDARMQIIERLKELKLLPTCPESTNENSVPFFDVKATSVNLLRSKSDEVRFCIWE